MSSCRGMQCNNQEVQHHDTYVLDFCVNADKIIDCRISCFFFFRISDFRPRAALQS